MLSVNRPSDIVVLNCWVVALMPATEATGAQEAQNHVVFLENFLDELNSAVLRKNSVRTAERRTSSCRIRSC
jgi:hypothetical protein